jgi:hypothetical protein
LTSKPEDFGLKLKRSTCSGFKSGQRDISNDGAMVYGTKSDLYVLDLLNEEAIKLPKAALQ